METLEVVTKTEFAALCGVTGPRVSQWLSAQQIHGDALVGTGHRARIRVAVAREQLKRNLDIDAHLGANGKARLDGAAGDVPDTVEGEIKRARLEQLALGNEEARADREARSGRYIAADDARREMGQISARMVAMFDGALNEFATAIAAASNLPTRDALHLLRTSFRAIRERASNAEAAIAGRLPPLIADQAADAAPKAEPSAL